MMHTLNNNNKRLTKRGARKNADAEKAGAEALLAVRANPGSGEESLVNTTVLSISDDDRTLSDLEAGVCGGDLAPTCREKRASSAGATQSVAALDEVANCVAERSGGGLASPKVVTGEMTQLSLSDRGIESTVRTTKLLVVLVELMGDLFLTCGELALQLEKNDAVDPEVKRKTSGLAAGMAETRSLLEETLKLQGVTLDASREALDARVKERGSTKSSRPAGKNAQTQTDGASQTQESHEGAHAGVAGVTTPRKMDSRKNETKRKEISPLEA